MVVNLYLLCYIREKPLSLSELTNDKPLRLGLATLFYGSAT